MVAAGNRSPARFWYLLDHWGENVTEPPGPGPEPIVHADSQNFAPPFHQDAAMIGKEIHWRSLLLDAWLVVRYTRNWLHYGVMAFAVFCSLIAAVRGLAAAP